MTVPWLAAGGCCDAGPRRRPKPPLPRAALHAARRPNTPAAAPAKHARFSSSPRPRPQQHKVLVVGSGGREHALAWKLAQSKECDALFCAPGSPGTAGEPGVTNIALDVANNQAVSEGSSCYPYSMQVPVARTCQIWKRRCAAACLYVSPAGFKPCNAHRWLTFASSRESAW